MMQKKRDGFSIGKGRAALCEEVYGYEYGLSADPWKMAAKRKFVAAPVSLYDDIDITSSSTIPSTEEKSEIKESGKRQRTEAEDDVAGKKVSGAAKDRSLISVCGWRKGEREEMQDAHFFDDDFGLPAANIKRSALYAIFDGHGGRRAADFVKKHLPTKFKDKFSACSDIATLERVLKRIFIECFREVDEMFLAEARKMKPSWKDGTTVTTLLLINDSLYCANIGDSRAVVCRSKGPQSVVALQLTVDHSPLQFEERMRIQKAGGNVKDGRILGVLEVSRSIGDGQFKAHGVTCIPDVKKFSITADDRFVLIACDGLWKTFSNQEAVEFVMQKLSESNKNEEDIDERGNSHRHMELERVADALAAESVKRGCGDNVSVIIITFGSFWA